MILKVCKRTGALFSCFAILLLLRTENLLAQQKIFWTDSTYSSPAIHCADTDGKSCIDTANPSNTVLLSLTPMLDYPLGIVIDEKNGKVIFANGSTIQTCNLDGTGRNTSFITGLSTATHLAIDPIGEKIYWTSFDGIQSANLDGSGIAAGPTASINSFSGLTVDATNSKLLWFEGLGNGTKFLKTADLTSLTPTTLDTITLDDNLFGMAVNETASRTFFVQYDQNTYMFAYLRYYDGYSSGGSITTHLSGLSGFSAEILGYHGAAIDFPETNIYYGNNFSKTIYRTSLTQGSASQQTFLSNVGEINGITLSCGKHAPDSDNDKTADCRDDCPTDPLKTAAGLCGCNTADTDSDDDGTADCLDLCKDDKDKTSPGVCGCGVDEPGKCGCGLLEDINADGKEVCVKTRQLAPNTKIEEPPVVEVTGTDVTFILEKFTKPTLTLKKKKKNKKATVSSPDFYDYALEVKGSGLKIRYEIQVSKVNGTKKDIKKYNSKKNEYALKNVAPGNYNVVYRPVIVGSDGKDVAKIKFSPPANFTVQ